MKEAKNLEGDDESIAQNKSRYQHCVQIAPMLLSEYFDSWEEGSKSGQKKETLKHLLAIDSFNLCIEYPISGIDV